VIALIRQTAVALVLCFAATPSLAQKAETSQVSFEGKQIKLLIGFSPGGIGYDTYGRLLAKHMSRHLRGNPTIVPQNRPGAGSLALVTQMYSVEPKDGTSIALVGRGAAMDPLLSDDGSKPKFDATRFNWLGSMNNEIAGFFVTDTAPATTLKDILSGVAIQVGSTGAGGDPQIFARVLNATLKTNLKIVGGYPGMQEIILSMARGELDGVLGYSWATSRVGIADELKSGRYKIVMQLGLTPHPELKDVPLVTDLVPKGPDQDLLKFIFARQSMGRPLLLPPDVPPAVVATLRTAFDETLKDPEFLQEAQRLGLEINGLSGRDVQAIVDEIYKAPKAVIQRAKEAAN
jgi:tripartite-type tricarboxylate transporter receptor subunit TctC